jgi:polysaccharide export outer membrane protein
MLREIGTIGTSVALCSCSILPGMQNLNTSQMRKVIVPERIEVHPTLIPITPSLIADQKVSTYFYKVAPADVLQVTVLEHPEFLMEAHLTSSPNATIQYGAAGGSGYLVNSTGRIYFPMVGYIHVAGKTVDEIRDYITLRLKKFVPNPQVNVRVSDFRGQKVYILGEVAKTGFLPINDQPLTIADALALSGWINPTSADPRFIYVIRGDYTCPQIFWLDAKTPDRLLLAERFSLQPRDILYVSSAPITNLNRALNQFLPIVQSVWFTKSIINGNT